MKYTTLLFKRAIFAFVLLTSALQLRAQEETALPVDQTTNKVSYAGVVDAPGSTSKALCERAKKWILTKNSTINPYTVSYEGDGSITGKGTFTLPAKHFKYVVQFNIKVLTKDGKCRYEFTDLIVQYRTAAKSSAGGWAYHASSTHTDAETLEYSMETFYPSRLEGHKPKIKWYEEINSESIATVNREMQSIVNSFREAVSTKDNW
jgi:hypothetical protein